MKQVLTTKDFGITAEVELIAPETAINLLETVTDNRPIRKNNIKALVSQIEKDQWEINGQPIIIDEDGKVIDGQHRLWAVLESGKSIYVLVVRGIKRHVFPTLDTGVVRTAPDVVGITFEDINTEKSRAVAVCARAMLNMNQKSPTHSSASSNSVYSHYDITEFVMKEPLVFFAVEWICKYPRRNLPISQGVMSAMYAEMWKLSPDDANDFCDKVITGTGLEDGSPELVLRQIYASRDNKRVGWTSIERVKMLAKAWNTRMKGTPAHTRSIKLRSDDPLFIRLKGPRIIDGATRIRAMEELEREGRLQRAHSSTQ